MTDLQQRFDLQAAIDQAVAEFNAEGEVKARQGQERRVALVASLEKQFHTLLDRAISPAMQEALGFEINLNRNLEADDLLLKIELNIESFYAQFEFQGWQWKLSTLFEKDSYWRISCINADKGIISSIVHGRLTYQMPHPLEIWQVAKFGDAEVFPEREIQKTLLLMLWGQQQHQQLGVCYRANPSDFSKP